jgi:hypothetical protein
MFRVAAASMLGSVQIAPQSRRIPTDPANNSGSRMPRSDPRYAVPKITDENATGSGLPIEHAKKSHCRTKTTKRGVYQYEGESYSSAYIV